MTVGDMHMLCAINPKAGHDAAVLQKAKDTFGQDAVISVLEEKADIYVRCDYSAESAAKLQKLRADDDVLDTWVDLVRTRYAQEKEIRTDHVYLVFADAGSNDVEPIFAQIKSEFDKLGGGDRELLYLGDYYSKGPDVVALIASNSLCTGEIVGKVRALPGVVDTEVFTFHRTGEKS